MLSNGLNESERPAILVLDLSSRTLEFAKATYELGRSGAAPGALYYLGFAESAAEEEWQRYHLGSWMANGFLEGTLKLPAGSQPLGPAELPPELVTGLPPKPDLTTLTWSNRKKDGLVTPKTPDKVLQAWHDHAEFGENFRNWLTKAREATALDLSAEEADGKEKPRGSRGGEGTGPAPDPSPTGEPDPKKLKLSTASLPSCFIADVPTPLSWSAQVGVTGGGKKASVRLLIAIGQRIFLCNDSAADITMGAGTILAGYFRGKWLTEKQVAAEPSAAERDHRVRAQRTRLAGLELTRHLECSHQSYDYVHKMAVQDRIIYLEPHRFTTRMAEVQRDKPPKEFQERLGRHKVDL